jgi:hypothetical protein
VFNNLVMFDQHVPQNSLASIVPDLATGWSWKEDGTELTLPLHQGVIWHDGKPFTAKDVQYTWDMLTGKSSKKLRVNPRKSWYRNLADVTANGDYEVTFHLTRPQPAFLALLASGYSPVYPCHISPRDMRKHPIGTGPFKFIEFKPNEYIKVARNPNYWKKDQPYLDGIEYTIMRNLSTAVLAFVARKFDMTSPAGSPRQALCQSIRWAATRRPKRVETEVAGHHTQGTLEQRILAALREAGKDLDRLDRDDLAPVDEFHHAGRTATAAFAPRLSLHPGMHLFDIGSGIGGPARYFARHHRCRVTGIDLTEEFVAVVRALTRGLGMEGQISFEQGSALSMSFPPQLSTPPPCCMSA